VRIICLIITRIHADGAFSWVFEGNNSGLYDIPTSKSSKNLTKDFSARFVGDTGYWASEMVNIGGFNFSAAEIGIVKYVILSCMFRPMVWVTSDASSSFSLMMNSQGGAMGLSPPDSANPAYGSKQYF
jgi:hypothetical protein